MTDLVERLRFDAAQLKEMNELASRFAGAETGVRVKDVAALLTDLTEAATALEAKDKELAALRADYLQSQTDLQNAIGDRDEEIKQQIKAEARAEIAEQHVQQLQCALMYWMPGVTEAIENETNGRCGDDAQLLAGYDGEFPPKCWGDRARERAETAERERDEARAALKPFATYLDQAKFDLDHKGRPLPDDQGVGWVYLTIGDFRRAARAITGEQQ